MAVSLDYAQPDGKAVSRLFSTYGHKKVNIETAKWKKSHL